MAIQGFLCLRSNNVSIDPLPGEVDSVGMFAK
jgi:hypothetical protein